jgi:CheY-like chemotaxis protein
VRLAIRETATPPQDSGLEPGRYLVTTVSDTGHGMDAETRRKAFEPFFTTKAVDRGTGLGLSMAQGFAIQSGGALLLKSQRDVGTEVELWLPAAPHAEIEDISEQVSWTATSRASQIALVVDDDPLVLETTSGLLEALGYQTLCARSGQDALNLLIEHPEITTLVTDDAMPGMTGVQLAAQVERVRPGMGVLLVSGYLDPSRYESVGPAVKFLAKPFGLQQLSATLADLARLEALRPDRGGKRPVSEHGPRSRLASATLDRESVGP